MNIRNLFIASIAFAAAIGSPAIAAVQEYKVGQIWEYKARPQDTGSLIKIQRVTKSDNSPVYHLSVIGVHFNTAGMAGLLPHIPVSKATLDASVIKLSDSTAAFPDASVDAGVAEWERARGGVFTIPLSQIINVVEETISRSSAAN